MPWEVQGKLIGYISLGQEFSPTITSMQEQVGLQLFPFIDKNRLKRPDWEASGSRLGLTTNWNRFPTLAHMDDPAIPLPEGMNEFVSQIHWPTDQLDAAPKEMTPDTFFFHLPIRDISKSTVGILVGIQTLRTFNDASSNHVYIIYFTIIVTTIILLILSLKGMHWLEHKVNRLIHLRQDALTQSEQALQSSIAQNALLETGLIKIPLQRQLEVAIEIILTVPWLDNLYKGAIFLYEEQTDSLVMSAQLNLPDQLLTSCHRLTMGECLCGRAAQSRELVFANHLDDRHEITFTGIQDHGHYCIPILMQKRLLGVLNLYVDAGHTPSSDQEAFLSTVAKSLARLIEQRRLEEQLEQQKEALLATMDGHEIVRMLLESAMEPVPLQDQLDQVLTLLFYLPWLPIQPKGIIYLTNAQKTEQELQSFTHHFDQLQESSHCLPMGQCLCGTPISHEITIHSEPSGSHCCIPILEKKDPIGIMLLYLDGTKELTKNNLELLRSVTSILSIIILRKQMDAQLILALNEQQRANQMLDRANSFIRKTFGSYMSDEVVQSILDTPEGLRLGGDEKQVTVLMSDLRGFTALSERLPPDDVLTMLNLYLGEMTRIIQHYQGTIIEFLGDGILALFGAPITREDDAQRAVACALAMQKAMVEVNKRNQEAGYPNLEMGTGINTGSVIAGNIGSEVRRKYGVVGTTINLAARIESLTFGGQVLISEYTAQACQLPLTIAKQWQERLKGIPNPITIFHIIGIDGPDGIHLPQTITEKLRPVVPGIPVRLATLDNRKSILESSQGEIIAMRLPILEITSKIQMPPRSNVQITLLDANGKEIHDLIYGKAQKWHAKRKSQELHLTSLSPETEQWLNLRSEP
ncbi:MAG: GAF domain-containing protein [Magnetococcales bacterium]|nr:GAF domain-containing protein [Magnetococcales bacterium]